MPRVCSVLSATVSTDRTQCEGACRATEPGGWMQDKDAADLYRQHRGALLGAPGLQHLLV